jgi:hypothetical protein
MLPFVPALGLAGVGLVCSWLFRGSPHPECNCQCACGSPGAFNSGFGFLVGFALFQLTLLVSVAYLIYLVRTLSAIAPSTTVPRTATASQSTGTSIPSSILGATGRPGPPVRRGLGVFGN